MHITLFSPELAEALGWTLLHSLWQGALLFILLTPVLSVLRNDAPQVRYQVLCLALPALLGAMGITFYYYLPEAAPTGYVITGERLILQESLAVTGAEFPLAQTGFTYGFRESISHFMQFYAGELVNIWLLGALIFAFRWLAGLGYTYSLRSKGAMPAPADWRQRVRRLGMELGIRKSIRLLESIRVDVPMIIGHFKPVILLPLGAINSLSTEQVEAIIVHELAHIRRHDFLVNLFLSALEMVLFYHPLYWWISNKIQHERELCCDDIAVAACGNARLYARTLLLMEEKRQQNSLAMAYQGKKNHLLDRIKRICLASPASHRPEFGKAGLSLLLLLAVAAVSWAKMPAETLFTEIPEPVNTEFNLPAEPEVGIDLVLPNMEIVQPVHPLSKPAAPPPAITDGSTVNRVDTIPYVPNIPAMRNEPQLPKAPAFPYTKETLASELQKKADDHEFLRTTIGQYREKLEAWQSDLKQTYLKAWTDREKEIQDTYENWKTGLKRQAGNDELAYALAVKKGTRYFEEAVKEHEEAIKRSEETIKDNMENYIKAFEEIIQDHEGQKKDHDERMAVHNDRMQVHNLRMTAHNGRMDIHNQRMSIHNTRMAFHNERMAAHNTIMAAFEKEFFPALEADGLWQKDAKELDFVVEMGQVKVNGKTLDSQKAQKYLDMLKKYGFEVPTTEGHQFRFQIDGKSRSFGNHYNSSTKE